MRPSRRGVTLAVWVTPGADREEFGGVVDGRLRVRLTARAREGAANTALVRALAQRLSVPPRQVRVTAGESGRRKLIEVEGLDETEARQRLGLD